MKLSSSNLSQEPIRYLNPIAKRKQLSTTNNHIDIHCSITIQFIKFKHTAVETENPTPKINAMTTIYEAKAKKKGTN